VRQRRPTSLDVARLAGVSRTTVSFVLNQQRDARISPETRRRVLEAAATLGYHANAPARNLAAGTSRTVGIVLLQSPEQVAVDALLPETLRGLAEALREGSYRLLIEPLPLGDRAYDALLRSRSIDALVISGPRSDDTELTSLADEGYPIIMQGALAGSSVPSVDIDNRAAARAVVEHLVLLGHRDIACVTNAPIAYTSAAARVAGFRDALEAHGLSAPPTRIAEGSFDAESGRAAMRRLLHAGAPPTAVFAASDVLAFGVVGALREAGLRIPADVSVAGFDDIPLAVFADPPLTTIHTPAFGLGEAAGRLLLDMVAGRTVPTRTMLKADLIVRASSAAPGQELRVAAHASGGP
jgi:LacI family transcriptional regulator, galactose operon repressor